MTIKLNCGCPAGMKYHAGNCSEKPGRLIGLYPHHDAVRSSLDPAPSVAAPVRSVSLTPTERAARIKIDFTIGPETEKRLRGAIAREIHEAGYILVKAFVGAACMQPINLRDLIESSLEPGDVLAPDCEITFGREKLARVLPHLADFAKKTGLEIADVARALQAMSEAKMSFDPSTSIGFGVPKAEIKPEGMPDAHFPDVEAPGPLSAVQGVAALLSVMPDNMTRKAFLRDLEDYVCFGCGRVYREGERACYCQRDD